ncbi:MAG: hypothetical protein LBD47_02370 [Treponema sp.]|nr:hypothetical protein [Treponema sp.]
MFSFLLYAFLFLMLANFVFDIVAAFFGYIPYEADNNLVFGISFAISLLAGICLGISTGIAMNESGGGNPYLYGVGLSILGTAVVNLIGSGIGALIRKIVRKIKHTISR